MVRPQLTNRQARRIFLDRHGLADVPSGPGKGADLAQVIHRLGFVQVDSVNTVARAHDLILFARRPAYRPAHLTRLIEQDRALFEHWTHDAAVIPADFYPHWHLRFRRDADRLRGRWPKWQGPEFLAELDRVLAHVTTHGEICAADLRDAPAPKSTGWWDWHPTKAALEYLWRSGALAVSRRVGFRKQYDLPGRVLPQSRLRAPSQAETLDWLMGAALDRLGFATSGELAAFWDIATPAEARAWCAAERAAGRLQEVAIETVTGAHRICFARPGLAEVTPPEPPGRLRVLSPFDPALRDRKRAERLFGFHYRIEIFLPEAQRQYGYYVFPLLEGDRLVGRIDMKADRQADVLNVSRLWPERGVSFGRGRTTRLEAELDRIRRLAGVSRVDWAADWRQAPR
ncbi:winged helix-turn-helix domain-containing protein [Pseudooceanicola aestuarii]|uniref:winged helix-turn-helix domain-containing protein n=1 Tax=Pseudooceanicola aestuarii TaxID=2697319 RepID=UPI0013D4111A|nr:crosslink repair DNA glycosylase YcaQ family protein [Pseudooceanicola aestuarii]